MFVDPWGLMRFGDVKDIVENLFDSSGAGKLLGKIAVGTLGAGTGAMLGQAIGSQIGLGLSIFLGGPINAPVAYGSYVLGGTIGSRIGAFLKKTCQALKKGTGLRVSL
jgi:hypothetical protein